MDLALSDKEYLKQKTEYTGVHPQKFMLWLAFASIAMFFAAVTSALLVKKGDYRSWENFHLPSVYYFSTGVVILLSAVMHGSLLAYRKANFVWFRSLLFVSFGLGCLFLGLQYAGWITLQQNGFPINGNLSGSFIYLITGAHGLHIALGLLFTLVFLIFSIRSRKDPLYELRSIINPKRQLNLELLVGYWHFVDLLWIYLFVFFKMNYL